MAKIELSGNSAKPHVKLREARFISTGGLLSIASLSQYISLKIEILVLHSAFSHLLFALCNAQMQVKNVSYIQKTCESKIPNATKKSCKDTG